MLVNLIVAIMVMLSNWLQESIRGLKEQKRIEELSWSLNFLSQVYTAIGLFEDAGRVPQEAISLQKDENLLARGYNLAFLGKLYLEWGRISDSEKPLLDGWEETQRVWMVAIVPLVRTYYAELLMHPNYKGRDLSKAERQLRITVDEAETTKFMRNKIIALWLLGRLALMEQDINSAIKHRYRSSTLS